MLAGGAAGPSSFYGGVPSSSQMLAGSMMGPMLSGGPSAMYQQQGGVMPGTSAAAAAGAPPGLNMKQISDLWRTNVHSSMVRPNPAAMMGMTEEEEVAAEDEEDMGVIETYSNYMPSKLKVSFFINVDEMCSHLNTKYAK